MPTKHVVVKGESLSSIARDNGFRNWRRIYDAPENADFRAKHPDPNLIRPGDTLVIPDKVEKQVPVPLGSPQKFELKKPAPLKPAIEFEFVSDADPLVKIADLEVEVQLPPNGETKIVTTGTEGLIRFIEPELGEGTVRILQIRNNKTSPVQNFDRFGGDFLTGASHTIALPADPMTAALPVILKQTLRRPGLQESGAPAADMLSGDFTTAQILAIRSDFEDDEMDTTPSADFFEEFRDMANNFATGDLQDNIQRMIDRFEANTGADYRDGVLTSAVRSHDQTKKLEQLIRTRLEAALNTHKGDVSQVTQTDMGIRDLDRPIFNSTADTIQGLTIAINDTHGFDAEVFEYKLTGTSYKGKFRIKLFDHFGLDEPDVVKKFGNLDGFRAWFILQHLKRFSFKPFITKVDLEYEFSGVVR